MNSIAVLQLLLQRAEADRDTAQSVLRQAEAMVQNARQQAAQLSGYRDDFRQRWNDRFRSAGTTTLLHCRQSYGQRLDTVISHHETEAGHLNNRVTKAQEVLLAREQRVAAVRKLIERRQHELGRIADRRDQRSTDEAAQRALAHQAQRSALHS
jgi:flagellar FliJ protein